MCIHIFILAFGRFGPFSRPSVTWEKKIPEKNTTNEADGQYFVSKVSQNWLDLKNLLLGATHSWYIVDVQLCIHIFMLAFSLFGPFTQPSETGVFFPQKYHKCGRRVVLREQGFSEVIEFTNILLGGMHSWYNVDVHPYFHFGLRPFWAF